MNTICYKDVCTKPTRAKGLCYNHYYSERQIARWQERRGKAITLFGGKCGKCGSKERLEFDHIDPRTKSFKSRRMFSVSAKRLADELKKCQLLCYECHKLKTASDRLKYPRIFGRPKIPLEMAHGKIGTYCNRRCRCSLCTEAQRIYVTNYRKRKSYTK